MNTYKKDKKLKRKYWDKDKDDDKEIKMIVGFTKRNKLKRLYTYKVVWDTEYIEDNVENKYVFSDARNLYENFWKKQK